MMGAISSTGNFYINKYADFLGRAGKIASSAVLGGTVSEIGGGKFANGAITGAFSMMFNDLMHSYKVTRRFRFKAISQVPFDRDPATSANICIDLKVTIVETHNPNGDVSIDGYGVMADISGISLSPGMEMIINADNNSKSFNFSKQYSGTSITQKGYHYYGEVHTGPLNFSKYSSVSVTLNPGFTRSDNGMGRGVPTVPGTLGLIPSQWFMSKKYIIK